MKLLTSQKNTLYRLIEHYDLFSPSQFKMTEHDIVGEYTTRIDYAGSEFYFKFFEDSDHYATLYINYSPGDDKYFEASTNIKWDTAVTHFDKWLEAIASEISETNLWTKFQNEISRIELKNDDNNSKFTYSEYEELKFKIKLLKTSIPSILLLKEQQDDIIGKLDHLTELAKDLGKYDWMNLFVGTIVSCIIQLNVTRENATAVWELIQEIFGKVFLK